MNQQSLYESLGGYDGIITFANDLLTHVCKQTLNWAVSGRIGRARALQGKNNCRLIICVQMQAGQCTAPVGI